MMTMIELFYGPIEPTWIVHPQYPGCRRPDEQLNSENLYLNHLDEALAVRRNEDFALRRNGPYMQRHIDNCDTKEYGYMRTVHFMVPLCCDKCETDVKKKLLESDDVESVTCDQWKKQVSVTSSVPPKKLLKRLQKIKDRTTFWPRQQSCTCACA